MNQKGLQLRKYRKEEKKRVVQTRNVSGLVVCACNSSIREANAGKCWLKTSLGYMVRPYQGREEKDRIGHFFKKMYYFVHMNVYFACMSVYHVYVWYPGKWSWGYGQL